MVHECLLTPLCLRSLTPCPGLRFLPAGRSLLPSHEASALAAEPEAAAGTCDETRTGPQDSEQFWSGVDDRELDAEAAPDWAVIATAAGLDEDVEENDAMEGAREVVGDCPESWCDSDVLDSFFDACLERTGVEWCRESGGYRHDALDRKSNTHRVGRPPIHGRGAVTSPASPPTPDAASPLASPSARDARDPAEENSSREGPTPKRLSSRSSLTHRKFKLYFVSRWGAHNLSQPSLHSVFVPHCRLYVQQTMERCIDS